MIIYRTAGAWGAGKGSNLTPAEVDENFFDHEGRIDFLELNPPQPNDITQISQNGSQFTVHMGDGSTFGPFTLPTAVMRFRGEYVAGTTYFELDLVSVAGSGLYLVESQHVALDPFDPDEEDSNGPLYFVVFGQPIIASLDEILDVEFDSGGVNEGDVLVYRGAKWVSEPTPPSDPLTIAGTELTLDITHANQYLRFSDPIGVTVFVPEDGETDYLVGTEIHLRQSSTGPVTVDGSSAISIDGISGFDNITAGQGAVLTLKKTGTDKWDLFGFLLEETT